MERERRGRRGGWRGRGEVEGEGVERERRGRRGGGGEGEER